MESSSRPVHFLPLSSMATSTLSHVDQAELEFVEGTDDIAGDDEIDLRLLLPCGHTAAPNSLFQWCCTCLEQGKNNFYCPALNEEGESCRKELTVALIRSAAMCTVEGLKRLPDFEEKLATMASKQSCQYKECPVCRSLVERRDKSNLRVFCTICRAKKGTNYEFCWQCLRPWKGDSSSSVGCGRKSCKDHNLVVLQKCKVIDLPESGIKGCPSIRACPTCGLLIEHKSMCKYVVCCNCGVEFCFACLNTAEVCETTAAYTAYDMICPMPVAPKQTKIPVWSGGIRCSSLSSQMDALYAHL
ncbi:hypothetical protein NDU88_003358 [Pleurodeles waltl]|uniref:RING-type domain-containing protein n=1 Tax=Pleurodeles waltl TaxID=8319 RepID=A0AAV7LMU2_PLEWA|nr:hypothetical protein NDU88_003358 [Pleurodeles waltl]